MSCMIQKPENTAAIADYIAQLLNIGFDFHGMSAPETLGNVLSDLGCQERGYYEESRIYNELVKLNHAAWLGRYQDKEDDYRIPEYKPHTISHRVEYDFGQPDENGYHHGQHYIVAEWHYKLYKLIQFYTYQCSEDATINSKLHKAMEELETALAKFIVNNTALYTAQSWE